MERSKIKRNSRILSWLGTDRLTEHAGRADATAGNKHSTRRSSFLPSLLDYQRVDPSPPKQPGPAPNPTRPPPFFHSRPLDTAHDNQGDSFFDGVADLSLNSLSSTEIAGWKKYKPISNSKSGLHGCFGFLKSFLRSEKTQPTIPVAPNEDDRKSTPMPDADDYFSTTWSGMLCDSHILYDHPFSTPDLTIRSRSSTRSLDPNILSPPPRPKYASIDPDYDIIPRRAKKASGRCSPRIDPAKWAEISISAAELVCRFGKENVIFGAADAVTCLSDELEEAENKDVPGDLSFFEMDDECGPLHSSPFNATRSSRNRSQEIDLSVTASSMAGSMVSLSRWPLPPHYERFEQTRAIN